MGFFKNLFKKKKGGTFFGNLIRKGANVATGGILGNGVGLASWEAKQDQKEQEAAMLQWQNSQNIGSKLGSIAQPHFDAAQKQAENTGTKLWLKRNWWKVLIPTVILIVGIILIVRQPKKKSKW